MDTTGTQKSVDEYHSFGWSSNRTVVGSEASNTDGTNSKVGSGANTTPASESLQQYNFEDGSYNESSQTDDFDKHLTALFAAMYGDPDERKDLLPMTSSSSFPPAPPWILTSFSFANIAIALLVSIPATLLVIATDLIGDVIYHLATTDFKFNISWNVLFISASGSLAACALFLAAFALYAKVIAECCTNGLNKNYWFFKWSLRLTFILNSAFNIFIGQIFHPYLGFNKNGTPTAECVECLSAKGTGLFLVSLAAWVFCREKYERPVIERLYKGYKYIDEINCCRFFKRTDESLLANQHHVDNQTLREDRVSITAENL